MSRQSGGEFERPVSQAGRSEGPRGGLPGADAARVHVDEVRRRVVADTTLAERKRLGVEPRERDTLQPDVDGLPLHVQAARGYGFALLPQQGVVGMFEAGVFGTSSSQP